MVLDGLDGQRWSICREKGLGTSLYQGTQQGFGYVAVRWPKDRRWSREEKRADGVKRPYLCMPAAVAVRPTARMEDCAHFRTRTSDRKNETHDHEHTVNIFKIQDIQSTSLFFAILSCVCQTQHVASRMEAEKVTETLRPAGRYPFAAALLRTVGGDDV